MICVPTTPIERAQCIWDGARYRIQTLRGEPVTVLAVARQQSKINPLLLGSVTAKSILTSQNLILTSHGIPLRDFAEVPERTRRRSRQYGTRKSLALKEVEHEDHSDRLSSRTRAVPLRYDNAAARFSRAHEAARDASCGLHGLRWDDDCTGLMRFNV
jgi:hypothetical protein